MGFETEIKQSLLSLALFSVSAVICSIANSVIIFQGKKSSSKIDFKGKSGCSSDIRRMCNVRLIFNDSIICNFFTRIRKTTVSTSGPSPRSLGNEL